MGFSLLVKSMINLSFHQSKRKHDQVSDKRKGKVYGKSQ